MAIKKRPNFTTNDLTFAAALMCVGKKFVGSQPREDRAYEHEFFYEDDGTLDDLMVEYMNGSLLVDPNLLMHNIRTLKSNSR